MEIQLIEYMENNGILYDENIEIILAKYCLKYMCLYKRRKLLV